MKDHQDLYIFTELKLFSNVGMNHKHLVALVKMSVPESESIGLEWAPASGVPTQAPGDYDVESGWLHFG